MVKVRNLFVSLIKQATTKYATAAIALGGDIYATNVGKLAKGGSAGELANCGRTSKEHFD